MSKSYDTVEDPGAIARMLAGFVSAMCRVPWLVLSIAAVLVGVSLVVTVRNLTYQTKRSDLISSDKDYHRRWYQYLDEFGPDDDMVVVVRGRDKKRLIEAITAAAKRIEKDTTHFDRLFYQVDLRKLQDRALLFLPSEDIRRIQKRLDSMKMLLEPPLLVGFDPLIGWKSMTLVQLINEGERKANALGNEDEQSMDRLAMLKQLESVCRVAADVLEDPSRHRNPWLNILPESTNTRQRLDQPQYFFSDDEKLIFLLVRPKQQSGFTGAEPSVKALRDIVHKLAPQFTDLEFGLTGLPVLETDEMVASMTDANKALWLAIIGLTLLYLVVYRGWRYPFFTVVTLLVGMVWALGWLTLTVGHLTLLSAAFAVMIIGLGDYGILWVTRFGQERQAGSDRTKAMRKTALSVGPGILTASITTAIAFYAAMLSDFKGVAELGWIAGSGVLLCALSCFTVLPALLTLFDLRLCTPVAPGPKTGVIPIAKLRCDKYPIWLPGLTRYPRWVIGVTLGVAAVLVVFAVQVGYDHNMLNIQARGLDSVKWEETLVNNTSGASLPALSYTATPEEALALKARYEKLPEVSIVIEAASLVPRDQERKLDQLADIQHRLRLLPKKGSRIPHETPSLAEMERAIGRVLNALPQDSQQWHGVVGQLRATLLRFRKLIRTKPPTQTAKQIQAFQEHIAADLADDLYELRSASHAQAITVHDLPVSFRERYIGKTGKWLVRVFAKDSLWEMPAMDRFAKQIRTVDPQATGKPFSTMEGLKAIRAGFLRAGFYALLAMIVVLMIDFRNWKHVLLAMSPLIIGASFAFGLMTLFGVALNPANMIALPLILGVGADNGVHVMHDYRSRNGGPYTLSLPIGRGIMVASLTTILGFGTLMIARHRGQASLGLVLTLGVSCCLFASLVFLPVLLRMLSVRRQLRYLRPMFVPFRKAA